MAKVWNDFLPLITPHLPTCPSATLRTYLAEVAADFFARTYLWRDNIDAIYLAPNQIEYDLDAEAVVEDVIAVTYGDRVLDRTDARLLPHNRLTETGEPQMYWVHADNTIRVHPVPDLRAKLTVSAVLKPSRTGTGVEDWIYETWADAIIDGTIAKIAMIPGKDWTDVAMAESRRAMYERAIVNARIRDFRGVRLTVRQRPVVRKHYG
jgi:hypothetical protein